MTAALLKDRYELLENWGAGVLVRFLQRWIPY